MHPKKIWRHDLEHAGTLQEYEEYAMTLQHVAYQNKTVLTTKEYSTTFAS